MILNLYQIQAVVAHAVHAGILTIKFPIMITSSHSVIHYDNKIIV